MKLVDILVEELPKHGGWDAKWHQCAQDGNGEVCFFTSGEINFRRSFDAWSIPSRSVARHDGKARIEALLADDYAETIITRDQYEDALAAKNEGWIEWGGGKCPLHNGAIVDVKLRNGRAEYAQKALSTEGYASYPFWRNDGAGGDIIAYRLHQPQEAEQAKSELNDCIEQDAAPVWNGEGLPPVGVECESKQFAQIDWHKFRVVAIENGCVFGFWNDKVGVCLDSKHWEFRQLRTEAERKREDIRKAIYAAMNIIDGDIADAIYDAIAAGKIPGVKLEDL